MKKKTSTSCSLKTFLQQISTFINIFIHSNYLWSFQQLPKFHYFLFNFMLNFIKSGLHWSVNAILPNEPAQLYQTMCTLYSTSFSPKKINKKNVSFTLVFEFSEPNCSTAFTQLTIEEMFSLTRRLKTKAIIIY